MKEKEDILEWLNRGGNRQELLPLVEQGNLVNVEVFVAQSPKGIARKLAKVFGGSNAESNEEGNGENNVESTEGALKENSCSEIRETVFKEEYCYCK